MTRIIGVYRVRQHKDTVFVRRYGVTRRFPAKVARKHYPELFA